MKSVTVMTMAELRELIRMNPFWRDIAWAEIRFRNQARQAFEQENGYRMTDGKLAAVVQWLPPDLSPPPPLGDGPLKD